MPYLSNIVVYPFKSFEGISVSQARVMRCGGLENDRRFAIFDVDGKYVNGKRNAKVHNLRIRFDTARACIAVTRLLGGQQYCYDYPEGLGALTKNLSAYFEMPVTVREEIDGGFPDDRKSSGPTVIGASTLKVVASWYPNLDIGETRRRFRANLEIADAAPFWEDRLYGAAESVVRFQIGDVVFEGTNPCQRCVVPTRQTDTGEPTPDFSNRFSALREATLPSWADASRFNHYYRLAVNTCVPESGIGKVVHVGDAVTVS